MRVADTAGSAFPDGTHVVESNALLTRAFNTLFLILATLIPLSVSATIPTSERDVLLALYTNTNGASWTNSTGWNGAVGSECTWYGIGCGLGGDSSEHVTVIQLNINALDGTLPDISNLSELQIFHVAGNSLIGTIPDLSGLTNLQEFEADLNQLTGAFPAISGLTNLRTFTIGENHVNGPIPNLSALANLSLFHVDANPLTGAIPSLSGLSNLHVFSSDQDQLTGTIPSLAGLSNLQIFSVNDNDLTGSIPDLTGLVILNNFGVFRNHLTGVIPALTGLGALQFFDVGVNQLTGTVPDPPNPNNLVVGFSRLCTNLLDFHSSSATQEAWNIVTGITPWYSACSSDEVFLDGFN